jgi:hypothetical protein
VQSLDTVASLPTFLSVIAGGAKQSLFFDSGTLVWSGSDTTLVVGQVGIGSIAMPRPACSGWDILLAGLFFDFPELHL